jgi:cytidylate kinase
MGVDLGLQDIITIDGPAGAGKSTLARALALRLDWTYLDTGALYRAVGLAVWEAGLDPTDADALAGLTRELNLTVAPGPQATRVYLGDREVTGIIREPHIAAAASKVSAHAVVREALLATQRRIGEGGRIVAEGRDMGTVVFPLARVKFFLVAEARIRARRRHAELVAMGKDLSLAQVEAQMAERDAQDASRALAPLKAAEDAEILDSTDVGIDQMLDRMEVLARKKMALAGK